MTTPAAVAYRARWILPGDARPLEDGLLVVANGRIIDVTLRTSSPVVDLGNVALIPGLVNCHTHLEFSAIPEPLQPMSPFTDWIRAVIAYRREHPNLVGEAIRRGMRESVESGVTLLADVATSGWHPADYQPGSCGPRAIVLQELLGMSDQRVAEQLALARGQLAASQTDAWLPRGLSPHAPYSTHPELFASALKLAEEHSALVAVHLAETAAEVELLREGTGEFRGFLESLGLWQPDMFGGRSCREWLEALGELPRALVVHGNELTLDELAVLARNPHVALVYCPRTHAAFDRPPHPWLDLLALGGSVAIGTDSRASNPDLSLWNELQFLAEAYPDIAPSTILGLGTRMGARALGRIAECGTLSAGKRADAAVVELADPGFQNPLRDLFAPGNRIANTMVGGDWLRVKGKTA